jgi:CRISPR-associated protein Cas1
MIKRTLYFGNPSYLSIKNAQLNIRLPEVENFVSSSLSVRAQSRTLSVQAKSRILSVQAQS